MNSTKPSFKTISLIVAILTQTYSTSFGAEQPRQLQILIEKHQEATGKVDKAFFEELQKLKTNYTKAGDLESANAVVAVIEGKSVAPQSIEKHASLHNKIVNTTWEYHHKSATVTFDLKESNLLRGRGTWGDAKWRVISDNEIIIEHTSGAKMVMTFDKLFRSFSGHDWDGSKVTGVRASK